MQACYPVAQQLHRTPALRPAALQLGRTVESPEDPWPHGCLGFVLRLLVSPGWRAAAPVQAIPDPKVPISCRFRDTNRWTPPQRFN